MMKKIYQADFLLLPEHEFWYMYIILRKGKNFYYECAGRCTEDLPDSRGFYNYEHACFTLDGQVLSVNELICSIEICEMNYSLTHYIYPKDHQRQSRKI